MYFWISDNGRRANSVSGPKWALLMCPRGGASLNSELMAFRSAGIGGMVSMLTPEEAEDMGLSGEAAAAHKAGLKYWSFPIYDHGVPQSTAALTALVEELRAAFREGTSIGVHCWAGIGRSCLLLACLLCAEGATPAEAFARLSRARGFEVPETYEQRRWVERFAAAHGELVQSTNRAESV